VVVAATAEMVVRVVVRETEGQLLEEPVYQVKVLREVIPTLGMLQVEAVEVPTVQVETLLLEQTVVLAEVPRTAA
jgi:hypothetical protein